MYLNKKWDQLSDKFTGVDIMKPVADYQINIRDKVKSGVGQFSDLVMKTMRRSSRSVSSSLQVLHAKFIDFLEHDDTKYAHDFVQEVYKQVNV